MGRCCPGVALGLLALAFVANNPRAEFASITNTVYDCQYDLTEEQCADCFGTELISDDGFTFLDDVYAPKDASCINSAEGAAARGFPKILRKLIAAGADINASDSDGTSALNAAIRYQKPACENVLRLEMAKQAPSVDGDDEATREPSMVARHGKTLAYRACLETEVEIERECAQQPRDWVSMLDLR